MRKLNKQNGITLTALVITIIILLILAGVTLSIVFNGGIIDKSQNAVDSYNYLSKNEEAKLSDLEAKFTQLYNERVAGKEEIESKEPGLYKNGVLQKSWDELLDEGYLTLNSGILKCNDEELDGDLVLIDDGSIISIGNSAFRRCGKLKSVTIPSGITRIGTQAFYFCSNLESITIPDGVTSIGSAAFHGCSNLTGITIPDGVTSINNFVFSRCSNLTSITIPDGVTSIGNYAFEQCDSLTSITIPSSVTSIDRMAFRDCSNLTVIEVENGNAVYDSRNNCNAIIETNTNKLILGCKNTTIPDGVASIDIYAFYLCNSLTSITIPSSVTSIGFGAFESCSNLTVIEVENGNTVYDSRNNCNAIIETSTNKLISGCGNTTIPDGVTSIGDAGFYGCSNLTSITIPSSITSIGNNAFGYCSNLTSITIPSSVTSIGNDAFCYLKSGSIIYVPNSTVENLLSGKYDTSKTTVVVDPSKFN